MRIRGTGRARWRQVPAGMRDQTAGDVAARRRLETRLLEVFARWGYHEVATPTLEFLDTLVHGAGPGIGDRLLKLIDSGGEVLTLRPEMTVPLARFAAARLLPASRRPLRLAYVAGVFRGQERGSGRLREFTQAGVELIGDGGLHADVEVIALAAEALAAADIPDATLSVGHAGFLRGILSTLPPETAEAVQDRLYQRAFADLPDLVPAGALPDSLRALPALRGPEALGRARPLATAAESREALTTLAAVLEGVAAHCHPVRIETDLGLIRDFDYYSGIVFEAHGGQGGMPLLGGGRYDGLLARFGHRAPATGFAMGVEPILEAAARPAPTRPVVALHYSRRLHGASVSIAASLRDAGLAVVAVPAGVDAGEADCAVEMTADRLLVRSAGRGIRTTAGDLVPAVRTLLEARS